jgi:aryl-alcohol dehydrogenase-like predicted oxidoreductase
VSGSPLDRDFGRVVLGTASWSLDDPPLTLDEASAVVAAASHAGVTMADTARVYAAGNAQVSSEQLLGEAIRRAAVAGDIAVASKGGHFRRGARFVVDGRPETIRENCDDSLRALGLEQIALYFLHRPDPAVLVAESVGALAELQQEGKIDRIGVSNVSVAQLAEARTVAEIAAVQNHTHVLEPDPVLEACERAGIAYLAYAPFNGSAEALAVAGSATVRTAACERGCTPRRLALALLLASSARLAAVVGARRPATVEDSAAAATLGLAESEATAIVRLVREEVGRPG